MNSNKLLKKELELSIKWFWDVATNKDENSKGYGLVLDRSNDDKISSVASIGFALSAFIIGVERGFLSRTEVKKHVVKTLTTLGSLKRFKGFLPHFLDINTAEMKPGSEYSTIDTGLLVQGLIVVESYFEDNIITEKIKKFIAEIDWNWMIFKTKDSRKLLHMAYNPSKTGDYVVDGNNGFIYHWSMPGEQLMLYFQAAMSDKISDELAKELYLGFQRTSLVYDGISYVAPARGAMFLHQFSHAWINFEKLTDLYNFSWFNNAVSATNVAIRFSKSNPLNLKGANKYAWGFSASDSPSGYFVGGLPPFHNGIMSIKNANIDGTIQPYSMISSLPFRPKHVKKSIMWTYNNHNKLWGEYGFTESYNVEGENPWYCDHYLGIDKGISTIMIDNYYNGTIWKLFDKSEFFRKASEKLGFRRINEKVK